MGRHWVNVVRNSLEVNLFRYIWTGQGLNIDTKYIKELLKTTRQAQFVLRWNSEMDLSRNCYLCKHLKALFKLEPSMLKLSSHVSQYIVIFRCSNHKLAIETVRYFGIDRSLRSCGMCNLDVLGDEYHFLCEYIKLDIMTLRQQCIPRYNLQNPSVFKLIQCTYVYHSAVSSGFNICDIQLLKSSEDAKVGKRISMFIKKCKIA